MPLITAWEPQEKEEVLKHYTRYQLGPRAACDTAPLGPSSSLQVPSFALF
jgi:hypothetical protein